MWGIGILTWNDPGTCRSVVTALLAGLTITPVDHVYVLDNGSDPPFTFDMPGLTDIVRSASNLGAGGGMSATIKSLLALDVDHLLFLEDDWQLVRPFTLASLEPLLDDPAVGQLRLGVRATRPSQAYYTYGLGGPEADAAAEYVRAPHVAYAFGRYQRIRSLWSNNPFACRRDVAERFLLTGLDESKMARPYYAAGLTTLSTTPGHFQHLGTIRDRRGKAGWKK